MDGIGTKFMWSLNENMIQFLLIGYWDKTQRKGSELISWLTGTVTSNN